MTNHPLKEILSAYVDRELGAELQAQMAAHLSECASCMETTRKMTTAKRFLAASPRHTLPADVALSLQKELRRRRGWNWRSLFTLPRVWIPASAVTALAVAGFFFGQSFIESRQALPLEMLLAAHSRYSADAVASDTDVVAANFSRHVDDYESRDN